jgi:hypothetical protein
MTSPRRPGSTRSLSRGQAVAVTVDTPTSSTTFRKAPRALGRYGSSREAEQEQGRLPRRGVRNRVPSQRPAGAATPSGTHCHHAGCSTGGPPDRVAPATVADGWKWYSAPTRVSGPSGGGIAALLLVTALLCDVMQRVSPRPCREPYEGTVGVMARRRSASALYTFQIAGRRRLAWRDATRQRSPRRSREVTLAQLIQLPRRNLNTGLAGGRLPRSGAVRISSYFRTL